MTDLIDGIDWSTTPLGAKATWSPTLQMMVPLLLSNRFPMLLWWGPEYVCIYNDAYIPILGSKHPSALGRPVHEVWSEIWHVLRPLIDTPFHGGASTWNEDLQLEVNRFGFAEETHFTIAYSPVPDTSVESGIGGVLATVNEITDKVIAERRVGALRDIATRGTDARTADETCEAAALAIGRHPEDLPFALLYLAAPDGETAYLAGSTGTDGREELSPASVHLVDGSDAFCWNLGRAAETGLPHLVDGLAARFGDAVPAGPWRDPPSQAFVVPLGATLARQPTGFLVVGLSSRLAFDQNYRAFVELVGGQVGAGIANARAYEEERRRTEALAELDRAKTTFFSNVSHEFRTPLTMMLGPIEDLLAERDDEALTKGQRHHLELAERSSRRLLRLVNTLLDFSRIEAGRIEASYEATDIGQLTADLASQFRSAVERAGLQLRVDIEPIGKPVHVDREMWEKIVLNLLSNALKSTFEGEIRIAVRGEGSDAILEVSDTGIGIPEPERERIFERFHRIEQARSRTHEGSGIGLALVKELVELHGGTIEVETAPDHGTRFTVRIPTGVAHLPADRIDAARDLASTATGVEPFAQEALAWLDDGLEGSIGADGDGATALATAPGTADGQGARATSGLVTPGAAADSSWLTVATGPGQRARILVVDDNADMRAYLVKLLGRQWTVSAASSAEIALARLGRERIDLIVSDVMMPGLDGLSLAARIRADPKLRDLPIMLLSARAGEESRIEGVTSGADDYMVKPFSARELIARVDGMLNLADARRRARDDALLAQEALQDSNAQLQAALAVKDEFLGLVSHELRTPLTVILGMSKVLERLGSTDERARELAADVADSADVLNGLVESMLLLARLDRDEAELLREPVLLHHAAAKILDDRRRRDPSREYRLDGSTGALVSVQPTWLERVIDNFVGNAAKYSDPGQPIVVDVQSVDGRGILRVIDAGPGLDPDSVERVFEPFYRAPSDQERAGGAGLGLAVAKRIIELMNGEIWARAADTGGAEFGFALPLVVEPDA